MATQLKEPDPIGEVIETQTEPDRDYEGEARRMGWKPEDEFADGDKRPRAFKDAETFVRDSEDKAGLQKQTIAHLKEEISFLKRQTRKLMSAEQNAYANALTDIQAKMKDAVASGDVAEFEALDQKADKIRKDMGGEGFMQGEDPAEEFATFRRDNKWLDRGALASASREEADARVLFGQVCDRFVAQGLDKQMAPSRFFAKARGEVESEYPGVFEAKAAPRAKPASDVAPVGNRAPPKGARTGANLPADAKATAERYVRMKVPGFSGKTNAEAYNLFAQSYQWE